MDSVKHELKDWIFLELPIRCLDCNCTANSVLQNRVWYGYGRDTILYSQRTWSGLL